MSMRCICPLSYCASYSYKDSSVALPHWYELCTYFEKDKKRPFDASKIVWPRLCRGPSLETVAPRRSTGNGKPCTAT